MKTKKTVSIKTPKLKAVKVTKKKKKVKASTKKTKKQFTLQDEYRNEYGLTMNLNDLATVFKMTRRSLQNMIYNETFPLHTFKFNRVGSKTGIDLVNTTDVVKYIESQK